MVPFWIPITIRHLIFRVPKKNQSFDNHVLGIYREYIGDLQGYIGDL